MALKKQHFSIVDRDQSFKLLEFSLYVLQEISEDN